jgi:hypothetical protein
MGTDQQMISHAAMSDCLSLFDEQFSIADFSSAFDKAEAASESVLSSTRVAVQRAFDNNEDKANYVVDMNDELRDAIESGDIELITGKNGDVYAQLRNANGRFGKPLPIKKELADEGITAEALQMALQMEAIKVQLQIIIDGMREIESRVTDVIQGQRNDRIGLFYSGLSLYIEARSIRDEVLRKQVVAQALQSISNANSQMIQDVRTSVEYLITGQYRNSKKMTGKIDEHISIINQCYDVVYRASFLKAAIYQDNGEIASMLTAIDEYGRFVEKMIVPYAGKLSELDRRNKFIEKGTWGTIAHSLTGCKELRQQIYENDSYLLSMRKAQDDE